VAPSLCQGVNPTFVQRRGPLSWPRRPDVVDASGQLSNSSSGSTEVTVRRNKCKRLDGSLLRRACKTRPGVGAMPKLRFFSEERKAHENRCTEV
jgi:hypothetical protein